MNTLPKFTEGPWVINIEGNLIHANDERRTITCHLSGSFKHPKIAADAHLIASAPLLYMALLAQEVASEMQKELAIPDPQDPRYEPFLGPYDGYKAPEIRFYDFMVKRQQLRTEALKQARGE